jgi:cytochrome c oxidase cbb3-type subunit 4
MNMTSESLSAFAASWGSIYFALMFLIAVAYALWPSKKTLFDHASRMPLSED